MRVRFWELPLAELDREEWEALCDGCGRCCLHKLEDEDTGAIAETNVACRLLDCATARCRDYAHRKAFVPDCLTLTPEACRATSSGCPPPAPIACAAKGDRCPTGIT